VTDDELRKYLKPKTHWGAVVTVAISVAGAVWGGTEYLHSRASEDETKSLQSDVFKVRLDMETVKGDQRAIKVQMDSEFKTMNGKLDDIGSRQRRR
jgi:hypothetical protein